MINILKRFFAGSFFMLVTVCAHASAVSISPPGLDISGGNLGSIKLQNLGAEPVRIQARIYAWSQGDDGKDILTPTKVVIVSPPFAQIKPGAGYTFRIGRMEKPKGTDEVSYRVLFDEIPQASPRRSGSSIGLSMRYSIPIFFGNKINTATIVWSIQRSGDKITLSAKNIGNRHAKMVDLEVYSDPKKILVEKSPGYLLPGAERQWSFIDIRRFVAKRGNVTVRVNTPDGSIEQVLKQQ